MLVVILNQVSFQYLVYPPELMFFVGVWSCGQSMGLIDQVQTSKEIIDSMVTECEQVIMSLRARL